MDHNLPQLVSHARLRYEAMGYSPRPARSFEARLMRAELEKGMAAGATGMACDLDREPCNVTPAADLAALAAVVHAWDGRVVVRGAVPGRHDAVLAAIAGTGVRMVTLGPATTPGTARKGMPSDRPA